MFGFTKELKMKIRSGFVSNSSSSSYIIGVGKVVDREKLESYLKEHKIDKSDYEIVTTRELVDSTSWKYIFRKDKLIVEAFNGDEVSINVNTNKDDTYITIYVCNNEGDGCFMTDEDSDINYDIDDNFFDENQQAILGDIEGVEKYISSYGAARNG
jgi:hypothetical protein